MKRLVFILIFASLCLQGFAQKSTDFSLGMRSFKGTEAHFTIEHPINKNWTIIGSLGLDWRDEGITLFDSTAIGNRMTTYYDAKRIYPTIGFRKYKKADHWKLFWGVRADCLFMLSIDENFPSGKMNPRPGLIGEFGIKLFASGRIFVEPVIAARLNMNFGYKMPLLGVQLTYFHFFFDPSLRIGYRFGGQPAKPQN